VIGYNFSDEVRKILAVARLEADALRHEYVGTEHILLAVLGGGEGVATAVLRNLGVSFNGIRQKIEETVSVGRARSRTSADLPYTTRAKKILEFSIEESRNLGHDYIGSEHLLLGIMREERGIAAQVLADAGLTEGTVRAEVRRLLGRPAKFPAKLSATGIAGVAVEVRLVDRSVVREDFRTIEEAIAFLSQQ
jgi:ATP-dependent Clp protease ATP-binding subunit ClpC